MSNKKITDLASYTSNQVQPTDLLFITDIAHQETKKITAADLANYGAGYVNYHTGSYSGSLTGIFSGSVSGSLYGTASYAISSSYSNYAVTASYALNGGSGGVGASTETITQTNNEFEIGTALYIVNDGNRTFRRANSYFPLPMGDSSNEVMGIVLSTSSADTFTIAYSGILDFSSNVPSYFTDTINGVAYFLSGSKGKLDRNDPSINDSTQISKPILLRLDSTKGLLINQRGLYESTGSQISTVSASYALTASYAMNGGGGGGTTNITQAYYIDYTPIGTIMAFASITTPSGYLLCDGAYVVISSYQDLYNAIQQFDVNSDFGRRYNQNLDGTYTANFNGAYFKLPDLRGKFVRGYNNGLVNANGFVSTYDSGSGRTFASLQTDAFANPNSLKGVYGPQGYPNGHIEGYGGGNAPGIDNYDVKIIDSKSVGISETRPVNIVLNYYIKYMNNNLTDHDLLQLKTGTYAVAGDVTGNISTTTVTKIQNIPIAFTPNITKGNVLTYDGTQWSPAVIPTQTPTTLSGITPYAYYTTISNGNGTYNTNNSGFKSVTNTIPFQGSSANSTTKVWTFTFTTPITGFYYVVANSSGLTTIGTKTSTSFSVQTGLLSISGQCLDIIVFK